MREVQDDRFETETPHDHALRYVQQPRRWRRVVYGHASSTGRTYERLAQTLPPLLVEQLERADAPLHIWRWVAWGRHQPERHLRLELALYLRKESERGGWRWLRDREKGIVLRHYREVCAAARSLGQREPFVTSIPRLNYEAAIVLFVAK